MVREIFNAEIAKAKAAGNADRVAKIELLREYFTNADFRKFLEETTWAINARVSQ